jgi:hypothetical protein
LAIAH